MTGSPDLGTRLAKQLRETFGVHGENTSHAIADWLIGWLVPDGYVLVGATKKIRKVEWTTNDGHILHLAPEEGEPSEERFTAERAEREGWTVDRTCYPWVAYKGPRFNPTEITTVDTPAGAALLHRRQP